MGITLSGDLQVTAVLPEMCITCPARRLLVEQQQKPPLVVGNLTLLHESNRALWRGTDLYLTVTEFRVLHLLSSEPGAHKSYRTIYDTVHYPGFIAGAAENGFMGNVRSMIKRIRNKFKSIDPDFDTIENYTGFGYVWRRNNP